MINGLYVQTMEKSHSIRKINIDNQLMVLTKLSIPRCGRKREIIYSARVYLLFLFIEMEKLTSKESREVNARSRK